MYKEKIKPKVEIISKILIKYHTFGNNTLVKNGINNIVCIQPFA